MWEHTSSREKSINLMLPREFGLMWLSSCVYSELPSACTGITLLSPVPGDAPACTHSAMQVFLLGVMSCL